nr:putative reverse transcriptase domain-containing protein [Tanacetum cinerariifolium]
MSSDEASSGVTYTSISSDYEEPSDVGSPGVVFYGYDGLPMHPPLPYYVPSPEHLPLPDYDSSRDDVDDEEEDEGEDEEEEEEQLASADFAEVDRLLAIPTLPPSLLTPLSSPLPRIPSPPLPVSSLPLPLPSPLPISPTDAGAPLGYRAAMIRLRAELPSTSHLLLLPPPIVLPHTRAYMVMMRAAAPSTYILAPRSKTPPLLVIPLPTSSLPLLLPYTDCKADVLEVTLQPQKGLYIALDPRFEVEECSSTPTTRPTGGFRADYGFVGNLDAEIRRDPNKEISYRITDDTNEIYVRLDDAQDDRLLMIDQLNSLRRDRRSHARTARLMESEAKASCKDWKMAPTKKTIRALAATTTTTTPVTNAQLKVLIDQGFADVLATRDADRSQNGDDSHNSRTVGQDVAHSMPWSTLIKMMTAKYCPQNKIKKLVIEIWELKVKESDKIKKYVGGLPDMIHRSVIASKPKIMEDGVEIPTNANTANNKRGTRDGQKASCFECETQRHFKKECLKLKDNNRGNLVGNGNVPAKVYAVGHAGINLDSNVVTSTLILNNWYASILFDTGVEEMLLPAMSHASIKAAPFEALYGQKCRSPVCWAEFGEV